MEPSTGHVPVQKKALCMPHEGAKNMPGGTVAMRAMWHGKGHAPNQEGPLHVPTSSRNSAA
eukprot:3038891-Pleurochrysis_carterae.AAC.4